LHFEHAGSRIYLYNTQAIAAAEPGRSLRLYEGTELAEDTQAVTLDAQVVVTDGGPVLAMELTIQLADQASWQSTARRLQEHVVTDRPDRGYLTRGTLYGNVVDLELGLGMRALAWFNDDRGRLTVSNNIALGAEEATGGNGVVRVHPVLLERLGASLQLMTMSRFMADVLGSDRWSRHPSAAWEYRIGERVKALPRPDTQIRLGSTALAASELEPAAPPTDEEMLAAVEHELGASIDDAVRLDEVAGNGELKALLRDVALSFKHAETIAKWGVRRPQGLLLCGDPGTGKTMLIEALANEIGAELRRVQGSDIYGKWVGESEANIKRIFSELRQATCPTIVFFDELEAIIGIKSGPNGDSVRNAVAGIFKQELNDLARQNPNVLVAAATNDLAAIDPSLIRSGRFDHIYEVALPDQAGLGELFATNIARRSLELETDDFHLFADDVFEGVPAFAAAAEGLSGADVVEIFRRLCFERAMHQVRTGVVLPITRADLLQAIDNFE
jgi:transitional endoplasmic reticulum ATPase